MVLNFYFLSVYTFKLLNRTNITYTKKVAFATRAKPTTIPNQVHFERAISVLK